MKKENHRGRKLWTLAGAAILLGPGFLGHGFLAGAQAAGGGGLSLHVQGEAVLAVRPESQPTETVREIDDPSSGQHWLLLRNRETPGGPGRLVPAETAMSAANGNGRLSPPAGFAPAPRAVIHAGDRVILEENTAKVEARLEAVALAAARAGEPIQVRLRVGGHVVKAIAVGPGTVTLDEEKEP